MGKNKGKPVYGVGINDADYNVNTHAMVDGKMKVIATCPYYSRWNGMLRRCYAKEYLRKNPSYVGCRVCDDWIYFTSFKAWMETQDWQGKQLDKDILGDGKLYSPETCEFVTKKVNSFLTNSSSSRGSFALGVSFSKYHQKYQASCGDPYNGQTHLGYYEKEEDAHKAWLIFKRKCVQEIIKNEGLSCRAAEKLMQRYTCSSPYSDFN